MPVASGGDSNGAEVAENETVEVEGLEALAHKPLLLFAEQRPWGSATGPDVPTIALYEDGLAIVHKGEPPAVRALTARAPNEVRALVERILTPQFLSLPARFSTSQAADQPTVSILVRNGARWKLAAVYGVDRDAKPPAGGHAPPAAFVGAYRTLLEFEPLGATAWAPEQIELTLSAFSHSRLPGRPWPADLPRPPGSVTPPKEGPFKYLVDARFEPAAQALVASLAAAEGVALNGHTWSMSVRRVLPEEAYIEEVRARASRKLVVRAPASTRASCRL